MSSRKSRSGAKTGRHKRRAVRAPRGTSATSISTAIERRVESQLQFPLKKMHDEIRSIYLIMNSLSRDVRAIRIKIDDQIPALLRLLKLALPHLANLEQPTKGAVR